MSCGEGLAPPGDAAAKAFYHAWENDIVEFGMLAGTGTPRRLTRVALTADVSRLI